MCRADCRSYCIPFDRRPDHTGYYLATLEASTQHIADLADAYQSAGKIGHMLDDGDDVYRAHKSGQAHNDDDEDDDEM